MGRTNARSLTSIVMRPIGVSSAVISKNTLGSDILDEDLESERELDERRFKAANETVAKLPKFDRTLVFTRVRVAEAQTADMENVPAKYIERWSLIR